MRSFAPTGHRHTAEVLQALRLRGVETDVHLSATAVDNVRGVLATAHVFVEAGRRRTRSVEGVSRRLRQPSRSCAS